MKRRMTLKGALLTIVVFAVFLVMIGRLGYWETHYEKDAVVIGVSGDLVSAEDIVGNVWEFYADGFSVGDQVRFLMFDNYTSEVIFDDEIERVTAR